MRYLYIRADEAMSEQEQTAAFIRGGFSPSVDTAIVRELPDGSRFAKMASRLHKTDVVITVDATRLAKDFVSNVRACTAILEAGATIRMLEENLKFTPDMLPSFRAILEVGGKYEERMRRILTIHGNKGGRPGMSEKEREAARKIWMDPTLTLQQAIDKAGKSKSSLYRLFGPRPG